MSTPTPAADRDSLITLFDAVQSGARGSGPISELAADAILAWMQERGTLERPICHECNDYLEPADWLCEHCQSTREQIAREQAVAIPSTDAPPTHTHEVCPECHFALDGTAHETLECAAMTDVAREVLCRVFDDGADEGLQEWLDFDKSGWLWWGRALGAFIRIRLNRLREAERVPPTGEATAMIRLLLDAYYDDRALTDAEIIRAEQCIYPPVVAQQEGR